MAQSYRDKAKSRAETYRKNSSKTRKKASRPLIFDLFIIGLIVAIGIIFDPFGMGNKIEAGTMQVHYIDVGQGDSALILNEHGTILIDAGTGGSADNLVSYIHKQGVKKIDYAIFTHPHEDHMGGASTILEEFPVSNVIMPDVVADTRTFDRMLEAIEVCGANVIKARSGAAYSLGDVIFTILAPNSPEYENINNYSIVMKVEFGLTSFMFTGDAEQEAEMEVLNKYPASVLKSDILKSGHHGSRTSSSEEFLRAVAPTIAVISCGADNTYGHPHAETLNKYSKMNIKAIRTDQKGSIVLKSDGDTIWQMG